MKVTDAADVMQRPPARAAQLVAGLLADGLVVAEGTVLRLP